MRRLESNTKISKTTTHHQASVAFFPFGSLQKVNSSSNVNRKAEKELTETKSGPYSAQPYQCESLVIVHLLV